MNLWNQLATKLKRIISLKSIDINYVMDPNFSFQKWATYNLKQSIKCNIERIKQSALINFKKDIKDIDHRIIQQMQTLGCDIESYNIEVFDRIGQWECFSLKTQYGLQTPTLVDAIKDISFPFLLQLRLYKCNLQNIEPISRVYAPFLQSITLNRNKIVNLRPLMKICSAQLNELQLNDNKFTEVTFISQLNVKHLRMLEILSWTEFPMLHNIIKLNNRNYKSIIKIQEQTLEKQCIKNSIIQKTRQFAKIENRGGNYDWSSDDEDYD